MTIPSGYAQVTVSYDGAAAPSGAANVFGVALLDPLLDPTDVAVLVAGIWNTRIRPNLTNDVTITNVRVKFGPDDVGPMGDAAVSLVGGNNVTSFPPNVALLAVKNSTLGGRRGRGRMFIPGVAEADADDSGNLAAGTITAQNTALAGVLADLTAADIPMVLLHEPATEWVINANGQPRRIPVAGSLPVPTEVTSLTIAPAVATQRRRLRR